MEEIKYIKVDGNMIINEKCIRWVKKMDECMSVCIKIAGCTDKETLKVCKINNNDSYMKLNKNFEE